MPHILVVDDEPGVRESLRMLLKDEFEVTPVGEVDAALALLDEQTIDAVLLDLVMPGRTGLDFLRELAERTDPPPVIVLSATRTVATAVEAMKLGAVDFVTKPFEIDALRIKVRQLLARRALEQEVVRLRDQVAGRSRLGRLIGQSEVMRAVYRTVERVAESRSTVLITGESGTGKELVARAIHDLGPRKDERFIVVNCAAIPHTLMESELFGHEKGAFTDARERRIGKFEAAHGGTLFLDEIGELAASVQAKLLRALQDRSIERLGSTQPLPVDVRVLAATNRDLEREVAEGRFRADLYYRIHVVPIELPPLRERREDVKLLAETFLERTRAESGRGPQRIAPEALTALERYAWPGNVRELENAIERAVTLGSGDAIGAADLPGEVLNASRTESLHDAVRSGRLDLETAVGRFESELIREALARTGGNQTRAAEILHITRRLLKLKMDRYGIATAGEEPFPE
ncbi:MAG: sigma-54 dependent transcriptional regulator [Myxococcota bacterium]|jgi:DNA-binding NtrC family response regulator|nr:sigma-54 dependent transcriptional regulator [Myxococcota bacterium]